MKLKTQKIICIILMLLPLAITSVALMFMPEQVPMHYGINGQVDRWGSKYENLIFPVLTIVLGAFMLIVAKFSSDDESSMKNNEKVTIITNIAVLLLFNAINLYFIYTSLASVSDLNSATVDIFSLIFVILGIGFVFIGNIMPKAKLNSLIGLRTPWSMKNEETWRRCQRFGGISGIITGVAMAVGCMFFFKGTAALIFSMSLMAVMCVVDTVYSCRISKKY
ncbi:MAG: SdpI family protein [Acutalibacteraceae bacterium]